MWITKPETEMAKEVFIGVGVGFLGLFIAILGCLKNKWAGALKKTSTFLQLLKETGMRAGEAARLRWVDVDSERNAITLNNPEKNSNARIFKASSKLLAMFNALPKTSDKWGYPPQPPLFSISVMIFMSLFKSGYKTDIRRFLIPLLS